MSSHKGCIKGGRDVHRTKLLVGLAETLYPFRFFIVQGR